MFGDRVKNWFTINEPRIMAAFGYDQKLNPPFRCTGCAAGGNSSTEPYTVTHNILLAHATAVKRYRDNYQHFLRTFKESVSEKGRMLEEDRERFQKVALAVLEMLNGNGAT